MDIGAYDPPVVPVDWHVYRIVPSVFPPVSLFDRISRPEDLEAVYLIEAMTNDRLRDEVGDISLVPMEDRAVGPGATPIMAAFTHLNPDGGRFSDATFGAYYAALELDTAIAETKYHREEFLAAASVPPIDVDMRVYLARTRAALHDVREGAPPSIYDPDDYTSGQQLARRLRASGSEGLVYRSVRAGEGTCVAMFRPRCLSECRQERHLTYRWNGSQITDVYEKREYRAQG